MEADYSDAIALIQIYFSALGLNWDSEATQIWLQRTGVRREELTLADLADLLNYLKRAWQKRTTDQIFINQTHCKFRQWEQMMSDGATPPSRFAHEVGVWMKQCEQFPEVQAEIKNLIAQRRNAA